MSFDDFRWVLPFVGGSAFVQFRKLGKTELTTSVIGLGTFQFGGEWGKHFTRADVDQIVGAAADCGINFIDTAECYGDHLAESLIGDVIYENRDKWILATKFGHIFKGHLDRTADWSPQGVVEQLERSLKALRTDYVDVYQFHSGGDNAFDEEGLWTALEQQVQAGKIRYLGLSIRHGAVMNDDLYQIKLAKTVNVHVVQVVYNRLVRDAERLLLSDCEKGGLGVIARIPLARGYLSGKYSAAYTFPKNDLRSDQDGQMTVDMVRAVEMIQNNEVPPDMTVAQYALTWILRNPLVHTCVVGCKNAEQVKTNAFAGDFS